MEPPGSGAAFLRSSPGGLAAAPARRSERSACSASSQRARRRPWRCRGPSHVGALSVGRGAGARGVVEAVFAEGLGVPRAADDDAATEEAEGRADPARVQRVAEAHDGGLAVGADGEPDGGNDAAHGWGDRRGESPQARPHADRGHTRGAQKASIGPWHPETDPQGAAVALITLCSLALTSCSSFRPRSTERKPVPGPVQSPRWDSASLLVWVLPEQEAAWGGLSWAEVEREQQSPPDTNKQEKPLLHDTTWYLTREMDFFPRTREQGEE